MDFRKLHGKDCSHGKPNFRPKLREILGLDNMASDLAGYVPKAEQLEVLDMDNHFRESWYLWVEPTGALTVLSTPSEND